MANSLLHVYGNPVQHGNSISNHRRLSVYCRHVPTDMIMSQNRSSTSYCSSINADIEDHLRRAIRFRQPVSVFEPMHHLAFAAPRSTAPALCIAACELVGGRRDQAMAAASALHLMFAAAYTHEHLQLTDRPEGDDVVRPDIDHAYSPNIELLTGDGIYPFGYELLARSDDPTENNSERILRVIVEIARAMGSQGWVEGQYQGIGLQIDLGGEFHANLALRVSEKKEGGMHACGAACGAILGGGSEEEIVKLRKYGLIVGIMKGLSKDAFGEKEKEVREKIEELKFLALKELESFKGGVPSQISGFIEI